MLCRSILPQPFTAASEALLIDYLDFDLSDLFEVVQGSSSKPLARGGRKVKSDDTLYSSAAGKKRKPLPPTKGNQDVHIISVYILLSA